MAKLTADFLLERLVANGVRRIYGYPGDGINAIVGALDRHKEQLDFVQVRHEEMAAFMACAHAKWTHGTEVGVCLATSILAPNAPAGGRAVPTPPQKHGTIHSSPGWSRPRIVPERADLERAAEILNAGTKVAMLVGQGALGAHQEVMDVAEKLGAGVAKALLGKTVISDDIPYCTGSIGLLGTKPSWTLMNECDTLLVVGSSFPYSEFLPEPGQARGVQIDIDGRMLNIRYPMEINLVGDSKETLSALIPHLERKEDR